MRVCVCVLQYASFFTPQNRDFVHAAIPSKLVVVFNFYSIECTPIGLDIIALFVFCPGEGVFRFDFDGVCRWSLETPIHLRGRFGGFFSK